MHGFSVESPNLQRIGTNCLQTLGNMDMLKPLLHLALSQPEFSKGSEPVK